MLTTNECKLMANMQEFTRNRAVRVFFLSLAWGGRG